jgi:hypothetical protein
MGLLSPGYQVRSWSALADQAPYRAVSLGDVTEDGIDFARLAWIGGDDKLSRYRLSPGDVLIRPRGAHFRAFVVPVLEFAVIAAAPLYTLRLHASSVLPAYVAWWVNRAAIQTKLGAASQGTHIPTVSREDIMNIEIPLPPLEAQAHIVEIDQLRDHERELYAQLLTVRGRFIETQLEGAALGKNQS